MLWRYSSQLQGMFFLFILSLDGNIAFFTDKIIMDACPVPK